MYCISEIPITVHALFILKGCFCIGRGRKYKTNYQDNIKIAGLPKHI
jgi:hypothetical protein